MTNSNQKQKWEYAFIELRGTSMSLTYLYPDGPKAQRGMEGAFSKSFNYWGQVLAWVTKLGQEGYEMTGVEMAGVPDTTTPTATIYWFKRPL
jgi:hypothetical protein